MATVGGGMTLESVTAIAGRVQETALGDAYAYCADQYGLWILDVSDPQTPGSVSHWGSPGLSSDVVWYQNFVYVCDGDQGLAVVDVSNAAQPSYVGQVSDIAGAVRALSYGGHLYVAQGSEGLAILDLTDPAAPLKLGEYLPSAWSFCLSAGPNFLALGAADGVHLIDITDPGNPQLYSQLTIPGSVAQVAVQDNQLFVLTAAEGVFIYDAGVVSQPSLLSSVASGGWATDLEVLGDTLIICDWFEGITFHDISDPTRPEEIAGFAPNGSPESMSVQGNLLALSAGDQGLELWDISDFASPVYKGNENLEGSSQDAVFAPEGFIYEAAGDAGLRVWDEDLSASQPLAQVQTPGWANAIALSDNWIYVADGFEGVRIFDRSSSPTEAFAIPTAAYSGPMSLNSDQTLYLAQEAEGFMALHLEGLTAPEVYGSFGTAAPVFDLVANGDLLITCEGNDGFEVFDVSDPANPQLMSAVVPDGGAWCAAQLSQVAVIGVGASGISSYDLNDPQQPQLTETIDAGGWIQSLDYNDGGTAIIAVRGADGVLVLHPGPMTILDSFDTFGSARSSDVQGSRLVCADEMDLALFSSGVLGVTGFSGPPLTYELLQAFPNPFNPETRIQFQLNVAGQVKLEIYDLLGREVAELISGRMSPGAHEVAWAPPPAIGSGTYFVQLNANGQKTAMRVLYVK
jgi:hypothetical protein